MFIYWSEVAPAAPSGSPANVTYQRTAAEAARHCADVAVGGTLLSLATAEDTAIVMSALRGVDTAEQPTVLLGMKVRPHTCTCDVMHGGGMIEADNLHPAPCIKYSNGNTQRTVYLPAYLLVQLCAH